MRQTIVLALHLWRPPRDRHRTLLRTATQRLSVPTLIILQHRRAHWMLPGYALLPISVASRVSVCISCYCSTRILFWYALNYSGVISWTTYLRSSHTCSCAFNNCGHIILVILLLHIMTMFPSSPCPVVPKLWSLLFIRLYPNRHPLRCLPVWPCPWPRNLPRFSNRERRNPTAPRFWLVILFFHIVLTCLTTICLYILAL